MTKLILSIDDTTISATVPCDDIDGEKLVGLFAYLMTGQTFSEVTVMECLRNVADDIEERLKLYNDEDRSNE